MKLFAISIVAKSFFGLSNNFETIFKRLKPSSIPFSISDLVNEKNATSAPEINAEQNNKTKSRTVPTIKETLIADRINKKLEDSGSNFETLI